MKDLILTGQNVVLKVSDFVRPGNAELGEVANLRLQIGFNSMSIGLSRHDVRELTTWFVAASIQMGI